MIQVKFDKSVPAKEASSPPQRTERPQSDPAPDTAKVRIYSGGHRVHSSGTKAKAPIAVRTLEMALQPMVRFGGRGYFSFQYICTVETPLRAKNTKLGESWVGFG